MKYTTILLFIFVNQLAFASESILFIGDSHSVMSFGHALADRLAPSVKRYAVSATTALDWLKSSICAEGKSCEFTYGYSTPEGDFTGPVPSAFAGFDKLLKSTSASKVIIALGTNDATQRCRLSAAKAMSPIKLLLKRIGSRGCFWVGPPSYERGPVYDSCGKAYDIFVSRLANTVRAHGCNFIDSRKILDPRTHEPMKADSDDQIHFSYEQGLVWGGAAAENIIRVTGHQLSPKSSAL